MDVRTYQAGDLDACLRIFDSNVPEYFSGAARAEFEAFLRSAMGSYYVMEHDGNLVGCGGFARETEPGLVSLTWGMIRRDLHRQGLGRFLLFYRLKEIGKLEGVTIVRLRTISSTAAFFERAGSFRVSGDDGHSVTMLKKLAVCP
jgi:N-acetylglutamate synthase-like GNAT family acetyltransferase